VLPRSGQAGWGPDQPCWAGRGRTSPLASTGGFTLVEMLVVLGVIALVAAMAIPGLEGLSGANARQAAGELSGSARALFDTAALRNATCRIALDLEHRAWWAECAPGRAGVAPGADAEDDRALEERFPDEKDAEIRQLLGKTKFGSYTDRLVQKRELPGAAKFGAVQLEGRRDPVEKGLTYVYFFPGGQAQRAIVPIVDGRHFYSVVVEPFTGRSKVVVGPVELRE
jgi:general secretion pathway protein H